MSVPTFSCKLFNNKSNSPKEVFRVIKSMRQWTLGKLNGKPVRVKYTVPVNFRLS